MTIQPTQERHRPVVELTQPETDPPGYEILVCERCGRHATPRRTTAHNTVRCGVCSTNSYRRLAVIALEPGELELLVELAEHALAIQTLEAGQTATRLKLTPAAIADGESALEKLYAERRYVPATWNGSDHEA